MYYILEFLLFFGALFLLLLIFSVNYLPARVFLNKQNPQNPHPLVNSYVINIAAFTILIYGSSSLGLEPKFSFPILTAVCILILLFKLAKVVSKHGRYALHQNKEFLLTILTISMASMWCYLLPLIKSAREFSIFNITTAGNFDVNAYSLTSHAFLESGFRSNNRISNLDLNNYAAYMQHEIPNLFVSYTAWVINLPTWRVMNLVICFAIAIAILTGMKFIGILQKNPKGSASFRLSVIALFSPIMTYIFANYFLGQAFAIGFTIFIASQFLQLSKSDFSWKRDFLLIVSATICAVYAYPIFLMPFLFLSLGYCFVFSLYNDKKVNFQKFLKIAFSILVGILFSGFYIVNAVRLIRMLSNIVSGWPLPDLSPMGVFGLPFFINYQFPVPLLLFSWFLFFVVLSYFIKVSKTKLISKFEISFLILTYALIFFAVVMIQGGGFRNYQSWKFFTYLFPVFYLLVLHVLFNAKRARPLLSIALVFAIVSPIYQWSSAFSRVDNVVNRDLAKLASDSRIEGLKSLNINLNPYFESMVAANVIHQPKISINSKQYFPLKSDPSACTLVRNDNRTNQFTYKLNKTYGLIPSQDGDCSVFPLTTTLAPIQLERTYEVKSGTSASSFLLSGWGVPESWGTWSVSNQAKIGFDVPEKVNSNLVVNLNGTFFLPKENNRISMNVSIAGVSLYKGDFTSDSTNSVISFAIPNELISDSNLIELSIDLKFPKSPLELNLSQDSRKLGFGLVSIQVSKENVS